MTILVGAFSLDENSVLPETLCNALRKTISRYSTDVTNEMTDTGVFICKVDIGAFGAPALQIDDYGNVTFIVGEPLHEKGEGDEHWNRTKDVAVLHPLLAQNKLEGLAACRGTFCGVHYNKAARSLMLYVDKTGVRPLYVWVGPHFVVFSTALRIMEQISQIPKEFDERGVTEIDALGYPLADRTAYLGIKSIKAGQVIQIKNDQLNQHKYWHWDQDSETNQSYECQVENLYEKFIAAITRRQRATKIGVSFLSGGLDSRAIVGGLKAIDRTVYTINFAPDETQDQVFASMFADKIKTKHVQLVTNAETINQGYRKKAVSEWLESTFSNDGNKTNPTLIWSGDGGSVALGHVYLNRAIISAMQSNATDNAISLYTRYQSPSIINPQRRKELGTIPAQGIKEELEDIQCKDRGRMFHLFLMFNDQRRHLTQHFENIDIERIEFQLPFFDADFLDGILRSPIEPFLEHRFYMDWLEKFPNQLTSIPWQAYPGHVSCPIPSPPGLKYQWEIYYDKKMTDKMMLTTIKQGRQLLNCQYFPKKYISKLFLQMAIWITQLGLRDYSYLINSALLYHRYWVICNSDSNHHKLI